MEKDLRQNIQELANDSLNTVREQLLGEEKMTPRVKEVIKVAALGIKAGHLDQMKRHQDASLALRLLPHLPKEVDKDEYVRITNPQIKSIMAGRPKE